MSRYNQLDYQGDHTYDSDDPYHPANMDPYGHHGTPPQGHPLQNHPEMSQQHLEIPMGPGPGNTHDRLQSQPTYSVTNLPGTAGHNDQYEAHNYPPQYHQSGGQDLAFSPEAHHDAYYNQPYNPTAHDGDPLNQQHSSDQGHYWPDDRDDRPMLPPETTYGPNPHDPSTPVSEDPYNQSYSDLPKKQAPIRRWKTVKEVQLFDGNLVLDCPIPPRLLNQVPHATPPERDEFTHMRYSAATCDPSHFYEDRFTLRQKLFAKPRHTELFIVITMYNEEDELFARTLIGVIKNIEYMNARKNSKTWYPDAWKKIVVCVVSDGRAKINPRTRAVLAALGVFQEGIAKQEVNGKPVTAHIYEYTTQMTLEIKRGVVQVKQGNTPVQMLFCLKEKNQKKINSHRWFFQAFGRVLDPNICVLIDAGTKPGKDSIYQLWKAFDIEPMCAGACGEIKAMLAHGKNLLNPLVATQNFEYKMSNILDKPLESAFGFISVLPGAFSAYRYMALQDDKNGAGPLEKYFLGEKLHGTSAGVFTANMYLAEDRILCWELVSKRNCHWILQYVKSATGETDVPTEMSDFILQRRRWLNGSFFAAVYALAHSMQLFRSNHSALRKLMLFIEFTYQTINMLFAWFALGNFFLVFRILTFSLGQSNLLGTAGTILAVAFEWLYLAVLMTCFVLALGNRPQGSNRFYMTQVYFWAIIMAYLIFASVFITVRSIQEQLKEGPLTIKTVFTNRIFFTLIVSMLSTYVLWIVVSILFFDPWHMITCFLQYLLMTPTYINILNVYAFCNTHDITWGTKGDDKPEKLPTATTKPSGKVDVAIPTDDHDLNTQYEDELRVFSQAYKPPKKEHSESEKQEDYYKGFRSAVVLVWMFCNLALAAVILNVGGVENLNIGSKSSPSATSSQPAKMLMPRATQAPELVIWDNVPANGVAQAQITDAPSPLELGEAEFLVPTPTKPELARRQTTGGSQTSSAPTSTSTSTNDDDQVVNQRATIYMAVVLYSVAGLSAFRFIGAMWFLVVRLFRGV
ncbi:MAG: Chitin synthase, class 1 [Bogoriella megaspora]|nr:MAG: Chitin synthase, class 1 [Bogoriella megaspora]